MGATLSENQDVETRPNIKNYYVKYDSILLPNLIKMRTLEILMLLIASIGMGMVWLLFVWLNFSGVLALNPVVQIEYSTWIILFQRAYNFTWIMMVMHGLMLYLRYMAIKLTKIPVARRDQMKKDSEKSQNEGIKASKDYPENETEFGIALRNPFSYFIVGVLGIFSLLVYLNYFPRRESLFPSMEIISTTLAIIYRPAEYATFFRINIIFQLIILMFYLFQFFYGLRQFKDITKTIRSKQENPETKQEMKGLENDWKPPLPKPWNQMTFAERKEYKAQVFAIEKQRAIVKEQEKLAQFIAIEREKRRIGEGLYKEKQKDQQKEKKLQEKMEKLEKKKKDSLQKTRGQYDFR
jgi:hypothetical protein